ncbi:MAG: exosortase/archaeosortase family protein, partial [Gammaproteobacteria bacterium]
MNEHADHKQTQGEIWLLGLMLLLAGLAYRDLVFWDSAPQIRANVTGWFFNPSDSSPQLIYVLVIGLLYIRRKDIAAAFRGDGAPWSAVLFLVPGVCLYIWGYYLGVTDVVFLSFLLVGFGTARLLSGRRLTRAILPPALILLLAAPLPGVLINLMIFPLQLWTAEHSAWLLNLIGIPALAKGDMITMAGSSRWVAESCTALGFIKWLTVFALAYVYLFRLPRLHALILVLSAPLIAYSVNLLRAFSLIINPKSEILSLHAAQGVIFFLIGFFLLYALDNLLLRLLRNSRHAERVIDTTTGKDKPPRRKHTQVLLLVAMFASLLLVSIGLPRWTAMPRYAMFEIDLPEQIGHWKMAGTPKVNHRFLGSVRYSSYLYRRYTSDDRQVWIFIGYDDRRRRYRSLVSDKNAFEKKIGLVEKRTRIDPGSGDQPVVAVLSEMGTFDVLTWHWYRGSASRPMEVLRAFLALDQSPLRRPGGAVVIRLATPVVPTPQARAQAENRLVDFLGQLQTVVRQTPDLQIGP